MIAFALILASFPARNGDLWQHLSAGRAVAQRASSDLSPTWLFDLTCYIIYEAAGGAGLVSAKALAVATAAVLLLRASWSAGGGWRLPVACTALAVLAAGSRLPLQPATASFLFFAVLVRLLSRVTDDEGGPTSVWPGWPLAVLFITWANVDRWFLLGLATVALTWLGRALDGRELYPFRRVGAFAVLAGVSLVNPAHLTGFPLPAELGWGAGAEPQAIRSPFQRVYLTTFGDSPAALAYYPLLGLGVVSFLIVPRWQWARFLPWLALAVLTGIQVRTVPFFAAAAGPVAAWNLHDYYARGPRPTYGRPARLAAQAATAALAAAFLVCAWPGWLQGPPFGPRRWAVEPLPAVAPAATALLQFQMVGLWPAGTRTLHLAPDTAHAFAWYCPEDTAFLDDRLTEAVAREDEPDEALADRLRAAGVSRVVIHVADRRVPPPALDRMLGNPDLWPILYMDRGVVIFGQREPGRVGPDDSFRRVEVDLDSLAFRPSEKDKAPPTAAVSTAARRLWWEAFWKPAPPPPGDRYEAVILFRKAEALQRAAPVRHLAAWEAGQAAALAAATAHPFGVGPAADAAVRLILLRPPVPEGAGPVPPITQFTFLCQQPFVLGRDDVPPGVLLAAVRAARRAVAADPADARSHLLLGQCYLRLLTATRERVWAIRLSHLAELRQAEATAALNRAVVLNPNLADGHRELGRLYLQTGALDLALTHLRAYREATGRDAVPGTELADLAAAVGHQAAEFAAASARSRVADRAKLATERGLVGRARAILLESDVSAFGADGMGLELDLLLRTGRADDVWEWTTPELEGALGAARYHWLRTQAAAAIGDYAAADAELIGVGGAGGPDPHGAATASAVLAGRLALGERPFGVGLPAVLARAVARAEFGDGVRQLARLLAEQADAATVRGLLALETGEVDRAATAFRAALACSSGRPADAGLEFNGRPAARELLSLLR